MANNNGKLYVSTTKGELKCFEISMAQSSKGSSQQWLLKYFPNSKNKNHHTINYSHPFLLRFDSNIDKKYASKNLGK